MASCTAIVPRPSQNPINKGGMIIHLQFYRYKNIDKANCHLILSHHQKIIIVQKQQKNKHQLLIFFSFLVIKIHTLRKNM